MDWEFKENSALERLYRAGPWLTAAEVVLLLISAGLRPVFIVIWPREILDEAAFLPPMAFLVLWAGLYGLLLVYSLLRRRYIPPRIWGGMLLSGAIWPFLWQFDVGVARCGGWERFLTLLAEPFRGGAWREGSQRRGRIELQAGAHLRLRFFRLPAQVLHGMICILKISWEK